VPKTHAYHVRVVWTGDRGTGTSSYRAYGRDHVITSPGDDGAQAAGGTRGPGTGDERRPDPIAASSDPAFRGDPGRWNPEQLLTAALAQCHMLGFLHLSAVSGVVVTGYADDAEGQMAEAADGGGRFTEVVLRPRVTVSSPDMIEKAISLHEPAHEMCFIANSVNFPVRCEPVVVTG
jgi:organic hydroperoxide reductase OsmC/OhrA